MKSLTEQNLTVIPMRTGVYSVVVDIEQLDVITEEYVKALEEASKYIPVICDLIFIWKYAGTSTWTPGEAIEVMVMD